MHGIGRPQGWDAFLILGIGSLTPPGVTPEIHEMADVSHVSCNPESGHDGRMQTLERFHSGLDEQHLKLSNQCQPSRQADRRGTSGKHETKGRFRVLAFGRACR
jgi:hypothetical protein